MSNDEVAVRTLYLKISHVSLSHILGDNWKEMVEKFPSGQLKIILGLITDMENLNGTLQGAEQLGDVE